MPLSESNAQNLLEQKGYKVNSFIAPGTYAFTFDCINPKGKQVAVKVIHSPDVAKVTREIDAIIKTNSMSQINPADFPGFEFSQSHVKKYKTFTKYINKSQIVVDPFRYRGEYVAIAEAKLMDGDTFVHSRTSAALPEGDSTEGYINHTLIIGVAKSALKALKLIHSRGFIHLDIKPENILTKASLSKSMQPKQIFSLTDFGFLTSTETDKTTTDMNIRNLISRRLRGTKEFQSPEALSAIKKLAKIGLNTASDAQLQKIMKDVLAVGQKADIYSLGASLLDIALCRILTIEKDFNQLPNPSRTYRIMLERKLQVMNRSEEFIFLTKKDEAFFEFAEKLTSWNPKSRPTADEALKDPYLN